MDLVLLELLWLILCPDDSRYPRLQSPTHTCFSLSAISEFMPVMWFHHAEWGDRCVNHCARKKESFLPFAERKELTHQESHRTKHHTWTSVHKWKWGESQARGLTGISTKRKQLRDEEFKDFCKSSVGRGWFQTPDSWPWVGLVQGKETLAWCVRVR